VLKRVCTAQTPTVLVCHGLGCRTDPALWLAWLVECSSEWSHQWSNLTT
jgi:predicted alpha/beta hydrolase family esterase